MSGKTFRARALTAYATLIGLAGLALLFVVLWRQSPLIHPADGSMLPIYLLAGMLVLGELQPLMVARGDGETGTVTVSSTFALAMVLAGPLSAALLTQAAAAAIDDLRRGRPMRAWFNVGQYLLTLGAARAVFTLGGDLHFLALSSHLGGRQLPAALLAAVTFFLVNNGLVAVAIGLERGLRVVDLVREDARVQGLTSAILLGLAPVAAQVAVAAPFLLPLLVLPIVGVQRSARLAAVRQYEALHDQLTGLPNRELFGRRTHRAIQDREPGEREHVAVLLIDIDHFKDVNDTLGHQVGDELLREVARRLGPRLGPGTTLGRLGGDEFAVLLTGLSGLPEAERVAEEIAQSLQEPVVAQGVRIGAAGSIGIALCPDHATNAETLLQRADIALYWAKERRGAVEAYRSEIDQHTVMRLSLMGDLHAAVDNQEFLLLFQPQVAGAASQDAEDGEDVAVEALMRWRHPAHGVISPDVFIPLAENTGLIGPMSRRAVESALETLALLRNAGHDLAMAVNISARLLSDLDLPRWTKRLLIATSVPPSRLTIEVTESTITADPERAMQVLQELREAGIRIAIDDFGTGYSSLSYLRRLQPDELKVDKSFVMQMNDDENSAVIVRSTVELGHGLGLSVVAEGVEDQPTYDALTDLGCDRLQGFHIARPMNELALKTWLDARQVRRLVGRSTTPLLPRQAGPGQVPGSLPDLGATGNGRSN